MDTIGSYQLLAPINETAHSSVYRVRREGEAGTRILKLYKTRYPTSAEIARFRHEYELIRNIDLEGVVRTYDLIEHGEQFALVLEDFEGVSLREITRDEGAFTLRRFLPIAVRLARTLGELHGQGVVHRDIKPHNILVNRTTGAVKFIDFGIASVLTHEQEEIYHPEVIEGTLVYMSPEQTGRMNRTVDYRTDFYSLGVTFYEMLHGAVPFTSEDPLEIIHYHLARIPAPLAELHPEIPSVVSDIIARLVAKTPEERYQNGFGLLADLERCEDSLESIGVVEPFTLAQRDISIKFNIPQMLVGRAAEKGVLIDTFDRVSQGEKAIVFVDGDPGIGKSAFINEIHKSIVARRGYFIAGKYDQNRRVVPYSSIIQAFQGLTRQILAESEDRITRWRDQIAGALGPNGRIIVDVIPDIAMVIGEQQPVPELGPEESQNRFKMVFKNFIGVFATWEHPLVLFLDDLQWADVASLDLVRAVVSDPGINHLYLIGAYRTNEVDAAHLLTAALEALRETGITVRTISLGPLREENVNELLTNFLRCLPEVSGELAAVIHRKTNGNPFFINQFLKALYEDRLIFLDPAQGWIWDMEAIRRMQVTDNVVELLVSKISRLDPGTVEVIKVCACIGNRFELDVLSAVTGMSMEQVLSNLDGAIDQGFVSPGDHFYVFHHDRIQEAAYSLIPVPERQALHYRIGTMILERTPEQALFDKIFYIMHHLNSSRSLVTDDAERLRLARLNMLAGEKAKKSTAYGSASNYYTVAIELLQPDPWERSYELTFACHRELGLCEYLALDFGKAEEVLTTAQRHARNAVDRASLYNLRATMEGNLGRHRQCIGRCVKALQLLGITLPERPSPLAVLRELAALGLTLRGKKAEDLLALPAMSDPRMHMATEILMNGISSAFLLNDNNIFAVMALRMLRIILAHGNNRYSPFATTVYGYIMINALGSYRNGLAFGHVALRLIDGYFDPNIKAKVQFLFGAGFSLWESHLDEAIGYVSRAFELALETGDIRYAVYAQQTRLFKMIPGGVPLDEIDEYCRKYHDFMLQAKDPGAFSYNGTVFQFVKCLKGLTREAGSFDDDSFSEERHIGKMLADDIQIVLQRHFMHRATALYVFGDAAAADEAIRSSGRYLSASKGSICEPEHVFYDSLIALMLAQQGARPRGRLLRRIRRNQAKMKNWAGLAPANFLHKHLLVAAGLADLAGRTVEAEDLYCNAITAAQESRYTPNTAIACELCGMHYLRRGREDLAGPFIANALYHYQKWGADGKVAQLRERHAVLLVRHSYQQRPAYDGETASLNGSMDATDLGSAAARMLTITGERTSDRLDFATALKASQAIASEIVLGRLLEKLLKIVIENAGAEKGFLIMEDNGILAIEAAGTGDGGITVLQSIPVTDSADLSSALVHYVYRTRENLVLNDAEHDPTFSSDPYIARNCSKSILCTPIVHQGKVMAILYLENNLIVNGFLPERVHLLSIISSQAAVSIDNARLYANLEEKVAERTRELKVARDALWGEMKLAAKIQTVLLPAEPLINGFEVCGYMAPADQVGGDYYDVINAPGRDWIVIGDVSGHGVPAGLVMMMVQTAIQTLVRDNPGIRPSELLAIVNRSISYNVSKLETGKYMTITALSMSPDGAVVHSGLHQDILVFRAATGTVEEIETNGMWLGFDIDLKRVLGDFTFRLDAGDVLLLYTDGVTEAKDRDGRMMETAGLLRVFERSGRQSPAEIRDAIIAALTGYRIDDDVTLLVVRKD